MSVAAGLVVFAIGNDARGDDALGPLLAQRIEACAFAGVTVYAEYQLQIEHVLDLRAASAVLFIDAAHGLTHSFRFDALEADAGVPVLSHALSPAVLLGVFERVEGRAPPPAYLLALRGEAFEFGAALSPAAVEALDSAWAWLHEVLLSAAAHQGQGHSDVKYFTDK